MCEIAPDLDVAEKPEAGLGGDLLERPRDGLQLRVVRRDAEPHEPPGRRQPLDDVHLRAGGEQRTCGIEPRRAGADDGDAKRRAHARDPMRRDLGC